MNLKNNKLQKINFFYVFGNVIKNKLENTFKYFIMS